jgi:hypothetical protein
MPRNLALEVHILTLTGVIFTQRPHNPFIDFDFRVEVRDQRSQDLLPTPSRSSVLPGNSRTHVRRRPSLCSSSNSQSRILPLSPMPSEISGAKASSMVRNGSMAEASNAKTPTSVSTSFHSLLYPYPLSIPRHGKTKFCGSPRALVLLASL